VSLSRSISTRLLKQGVQIRKIIFRFDEAFIEGFQGLGYGLIHGLCHDGRKSISDLLRGFALGSCEPIHVWKALE
jgi:hypothetical protein